LLGRAPARPLRSAGLRSGAGGVRLSAVLLARITVLRGAAPIRHAGPNSIENVMNTSKDQATRDYIKRESERWATAKTYRLDNAYLSASEKTEVELWFQFPDKVLFITFCAGIVYSTLCEPVSIKHITVIALLADLVAGILNWFIPAVRARLMFYLSVGHKFTLWAFALTTIGIELYHGHYMRSGLVLLGGIGLFSILSPSLILYTFLARKYGLHAKWVYFKKFYSREFPFEKEIPEPE